MLLEKKIILKLAQNQKTLSLAESCTGGLLTHRLTNISGSSKVIIGSIIAYSNKTKVKLLKIPAFTINKHGAVSEIVCQKMSQGARKVFQTDYGIGITGIAGPTGGIKSTHSTHPVLKDGLCSGLTLSASYLPRPKGRNLREVEESKPVGLIFISLSTAQKTICKRFLFKGRRLQIKKQAANEALKLLLQNS